MLIFLKYLSRSQIDFALKDTKRAIVLLLLIILCNSLIPSPLGVEKYFFLCYIWRSVTDPDNGFFLPEWTAAIER